MGPIKNEITVLELTKQTGVAMSTIKSARAELLRGGAVDRGTRDLGRGANRARNQASESQEQSPAGVQTYQYPLYHRRGLLEAVQDGGQAGEGRKRVQDRGVKFGGPRKLTANQRQEALAHLSAGERQADIARTYNVDPTTIGRLQPPFTT